MEPVGNACLVSCLLDFSCDFLLVFFDFLNLENPLGEMDKEELDETSDIPNSVLLQVGT